MVVVSPLFVHGSSLIVRFASFSFVGIWWFPILRAPSWFKMFHNASSKNAKSNSEQFRAWVQEYKPIDGYRGWGV